MNEAKFYDKLFTSVLTSCRRIDFVALVDNSGKLLAGKECQSKLKSENDSEFPRLLVDCIFEGIAEIKSNNHVRSKGADNIITVSVFDFNDSTLGIIPIKFTRNLFLCVYGEFNFLDEKISQSLDLVSHN